MPRASLWSYRRWLYAGYMLVAAVKIPMRTGFHLVSPSCDTALTLHNVQLSMTKVPHMVLFGVFFLITVVQFDRVDRKAVAWSLVATAALGLLIELEEGATRTGNCRITDVLPDIFGALIAAIVVTAAMMTWNVLRPRTSTG
jgi:hypothetical protein